MKTILASLACLLTFPLHAAGYHVVRHIAIGGEGGWDYVAVDDAHHRLYVSHLTEVDVIDLASGKKMGVIEKLDGVHGIAIANDLGRGFITNGRAGTITVFDLVTLKRIADWKATGDGPDAILYNAATHHAFSMNGRGQNVTVFDGKSGDVVATIPVGGKPEFAVSRGGNVFVNIEDKNEIVEINSKTLLRRWSIAPCDAPTGLAFDAKHDRLFSVCENKLMVVSDAEAGKVVTTVPIGAGTDGAAFDAKAHLAFSSNGADGTITVVREVSPQKFEVTETVNTGRGARTIVLDPETRHLFTPTAKFGPPPAPTAERPHPRPSIEPGTFEVIEVAP